MHLKWSRPDLEYDAIEALFRVTRISGNQDVAFYFGTDGRSNTWFSWDGSATKGLMIGASLSTGILLCGKGGYRSIVGR